MAAVTTATLIVLIWYTVETYKLRLEAQRQSENSIMPIVMLQSVYVQGEHMGISRPTIRNLGSGPAFNVYVGPMQISGKAVVFEHPRMLAPGQDEFVAVSGLRQAMRHSDGGFDDGKIHHTNDLRMAFKSTQDVAETTGVITYMSASGKKYRTTFTVDHTSDDESFVRFDGVEPL
jgi:hypothetical protein